jgi:hypothetical protein
MKQQSLKSAREKIDAYDANLNDATVATKIVLKKLYANYCSLSYLNVILATP